MDLKKNILISGASGLVGRALDKQLRDVGHTVYKLVRTKGVAQEFYWNADDFIDIPKHFKIDTVIHLSGENVAGARWTEKVKQRIYDSRILSTRLLVAHMSSMEQPPDTFICASAVGIYGDRGDQILEEESSKDVVSKGFLVSVAHDWEREAQKYSELVGDSRTINARIGIVLAEEGGALEKMLPVFKMGMGGPLGSGNQYMSWISRKDLVNAFQFCVENQQVSGPLNFCSPEPLTNASFTSQLGSYLHRPTLLPAPAFGLKLALGEMASELLLSSTRAIPKGLSNYGFEFEHKTLEAALKSELGGSS